MTHTDSAPIDTHQVSDLLAKVPTGLLIGGAWRDASDGATFDVENPATGETLATLASATRDDATAALDAACAVQDSWARTASRVRAELLRRTFELVQEHAEDLATLMTLEMGKPLAEARGEVTYGGEFLRWFSEEASRIYGHYQDNPEGTLRMLVRRKPVGPCLLITPWNFPLAMATRKLAPALAAGCTAILKPARLTPLTSQYFASLLVEAGLPDGVVNVVCSASASNVSEPLLSDPRLRKLSFTGSTEVGQRLLSAASTNVLRTSMELGGNAPFLVFADADLDQAVEGAVAAKMRNIGEACTAANRFLVEESVVGVFAERFAAKLASMQVGNGLDDGVTVGPLIEADARDKVAELVADAVTHGAEVATGGEALDRPGYFYAPTLLTGVSTQARIFAEEIFGPVAPIFTFRDEDEAVALANGTPYGLIAYCYTGDLARALRIGDRLEFGMLGLNAGVISNAAAPFGGVKQSGVGREGGDVGIDEYLETQYIGLPDPHQG